MIIGNGLIGSSFVKHDDDNIIIFASGVSNSMEENVNSFKREVDLIKKTIDNYDNKKLIYFSSFIDIDQRKQKYIKHKENIENIIINNSNDYLILKISQVIGKLGNNNNLIKYFMNNIKNNKNFDVYSDVYKGLIDIDDLIKIVKYSIAMNYSYVEVPYIEKILAINLLKKISEKLEVNPNINIINYSYDLPNLNECVLNMFKDLNINNIGYVDSLIKKYVI